MAKVRSRRILVTAAAAALVIGIGTGPALAAGTWTISPGGAVVFAASKITLKDTRSGSACQPVLQSALNARRSPLCGVAVSRRT